MIDLIINKQKIQIFNDSFMPNAALATRSLQVTLPINIWINFYINDYPKATSKIIMITKPTMNPIVAESVWFDV